MRRADNANGGVPGTVDIMNPSVKLHQMVGSGTLQHLASLILSSPSDNSTTNGALATNKTKSTLNSDASLFILYASSTTQTQTQFYLVDGSPNESLFNVNSTFAQAFSVLNNSSSPDMSSPDIKVTLQVPMSNPEEAAMQPCCATYDPDPPVSLPSPWRSTSPRRILL